MDVLDYRGNAVSGATAAALEHFEAALADYQSWHGDPELHLENALREAPGFVMAHVLKAYLQLCSRDPAAVRAAADIHARAAGCPANPRERLHLAAIAAVTADDYEQAKSILGVMLAAYPRDVLALQTVHALDYLTGEGPGMAERVPRVMQAWSPQLPGYHALLSMHAFALVECGDYGRAEALARQALEINPRDVRAHHAMAHVFEMSCRAEEGIRWLHSQEDHWAVNTAVATHCWWHVALLHLRHDGAGRALAVYDRHVRREHSTAVADLIDASSLLWRTSLQQEDVGERWAELAACWAPHISDGFCTFSEVHAMLAFVGAREWDLARRLLCALSERQFERTRHGATTRLAGLPACRALLAFGQGRYTSAARLLGALPPVAHRLGGSHAQREVLDLTLIEAARRSRRPKEVLRTAA